MGSVFGMSAGTIVESILDPVTASLSDEAARATLEFRVDAQTQARVNELAELARSGEITSDQRQEYHDLVEAFDLVAILKSKARKALSEAAA